MLDRVDDMSGFEAFLPYRGRWELTDARRYFDRPPVSLSVSLLAERADGIFLWREVNFAAGSGVVELATVVSPMSQAITRGAVLAHGGTDDGRRFFLSEAVALAAQGAAVILPVMRSGWTTVSNRSPPISGPRCSPNAQRWTYWSR